MQDIFALDQHDVEAGISHQGHWHDPLIRQQTSQDIAAFRQISILTDAAIWLVCAFVLSLDNSEKGKDN